MKSARIVVPPKAARGQVIEIKTLIQHPMETGYRRNDVGEAIPRHIVQSLAVTYAGAEIFRADMTQGVAANPYVAFTTVAVTTGDIVFTWTDDKGATHSEKARLVVT
jgi:sulfur-oxidizing protein SoxZ